MPEKITINKDSLEYNFSRLFSELENIKVSLARFDTQDARLKLVEQEVLILDMSIKSLHTSIAELKNSVEQAKLPWTQKASGYASIGALVISVIAIVNIVSQK